MAPRNRNSLERVASSESKYTRAELYRDFPDDAACLEWLWRHLYSEDGDHAYCPKCDQPRKFHRVKSRASYSCDTCGQHIHPTAGTIFHKSSTSLRLWFEAIYLMSATRCGISAKQLEREIGVTYKTAWRMMKEIRKLLEEDPGSFSGTVEVDESYMGGKRRGQGRGRPKAGDPKKPAVLGMVQRKGKVAATVIDSPNRVTLHGHIQKYVLPESTVYTDELSAYDGIAAKGYQHSRIQHSAEVYVMGDVHTNTIEGFWSLLKRGIDGVYHSVSRKYLQSYLNEYAFRYNHREDEKPMFRTLIENVRAASQLPGDLLASGSPS